LPLSTTEGSPTEGLPNEERQLHRHYSAQVIKTDQDWLWRNPRYVEGLNMKCTKLRMIVLFAAKRNHRTNLCGHKFYRWTLRMDATN